MSLSLEDKKAITAEVSQVASSALSAVIADYRGLTSNELTALRKEARESGVVLKIVRNTLARRAVKGTTFECITDVLTGPTVLAFAQEDPGASARLIAKFMKENERLEVKGVSLGGQLLAADTLKQVASLPTYDEAVATLMSVMIAPITQFVRTCAEPYAQLARTFSAVAEQKKAA